MLNKNVLKTVGSFIKEVVCPIVFTGVVLRTSSKCKQIVLYNDAIAEIMNSNMYASDKSKAACELKFGEKPEFYKAVVDVVNSSMFSSDKLNTILTMCKNVEES